MKKITGFRLLLGMALVSAVTGLHAQIDANSITDANPSLSNPFTLGEVTDPNATASGIGRGSGIVGAAASNRYNASGWDTVSIDTTAYFEWNIAPDAGYALDFTSLSGNWQRSGSGPTTYVLRSSLDGFSSNVVTGVITGSGSAVSFNLSLGDSSFDAVTSGITFRLYAYGATSSGGTFSINDYSFNGSVVTYTPPAGDLYWLSSVGGSGTWSTSSSATEWSGGPWDSSYRGVFEGAPGTVTISGVVQANAGLLINSSGYEISGGTLELGGSVNTAAGVTGTLSAQVSGTSGFTKAGTGTLVLTNASNNFTGTVSVGSGVLQISADGSLGDSGNDLAFSGGTLKVVDDLTLGGGRAISGDGKYDVADGKTLSIDGDVNGGFTLLNSGAVTVNSLANITNISFEKAATFTAGNGAYLTGAVSTTHTDGTAYLSGVYDIGSTLHTFTIANGSADVDMDLNATIFSGTSRIHKLGEGTLRISGDTSGMAGGVRIGTSNSANGGRVIVTNAASLGSMQLQFNWGTLEAESAIDFNVGISFGSLQGKSAVLAGADMSFTGTSALFETNGQQSRIDVNNTTTLNGQFFQSSSTTSVGTGLTVGGTGTLILNADSTGMTRTLRISDSATVAVNSTLGGGVVVDSGAKLAGGGTILGLVQVSGIHAVGNSAGIQTAAGGISYLSGAAFEWELVGNSNATAGVDFDQLVVSGGNISIDSNVTMQLVFDSAGSTVDWTDSFWDTDHSWTIVDNTGGGLLTGQFVLNSASEWFDANGMLLSAVDPDAQFELSSVGGDIILTYYAVPVPEPSTLAFLGFAGAGLLWSRRRRSV